MSAIRSLDRLAKRLSAVAAVLVVGSATASLAEETTIRPPKAGQTSTFFCQGNMQHSVQYVVDSVDGNTIHYKTTADGVHRTLAMPIWFLGTSLYNQDAGEKFGDTKMSGDLDSFAGLKTLKVGSEFKGTVLQYIPGTGSIMWSYAIKVADKRQIADRVLGNVEVYVIQESRTATDGSSTRETVISPAHAEMVSSTYKDNAGNHRECQIASWQAPH